MKGDKMAAAMIDEVAHAGAEAAEGTQVPMLSLCGKLRNRMLQRVLDRMKADLATDLDLSTLAVESGYSRSHFLRTFRAAMGCSPHQCLTRLRVEQAQTMLRETSISLIDIALDCGFSSHAHFSNTFRQIAGVTPSEYRRSHSPSAKKVPFRKQLSRNAEFVLRRQCRPQLPFTMGPYGQAQGYGRG
jgi:transcriptional regulator GlxA family with amidase domain